MNPKLTNGKMVKVNSPLTMIAVFLAFTEGAIGGFLSFIFYYHIEIFRYFVLALMISFVLLPWCLLCVFIERWYRKPESLYPLHLYPESMQSKILGLDETKEKQTYVYFTPNTIQRPISNE